ncbi:MAG: CDP-glucose 4,6-dehydratase [Bdellovibrionales bacterium]
MVDFQKAFSGKKVFLTGHTGFKGAWLSFWLTELGAKVCGYALDPSTEPNAFDLLGLKEKITDIRADIRDLAKLKKAIEEFQPHYVFHLAAQPLVLPSYDNPVETFETNIMGSVHLLEAVRATKSIQSLIFVTSDKCYKNQEWDWGYRESDELGGHDPYSASKAACEIVFSAYGQSFLQKSSLGFASVRAGNVIGGGDWSEYRIVADLARALQKNQPLEIRNSLSVRPWQHVLEPLSGYMKLAVHLTESPKQFEGAWNFGPRFENFRTVEELVTAFKSEFAKQGHDFSFKKSSGEPARVETKLLKLNCDKAISQLGWQPRWSFDETIQATAEWYGGYLKKENLVQLTRQQIARFMNV